MSITNKRTLNEKGIIFSLDAGISFTLVLIGMLVFAYTLNAYAESAEQITANFELEEKALMIADAMVKNSNTINPLLGACVYDADKKRVKTNELSSAEIKRANFVEFGKIFVKSINYETTSGKETITLTQKNSKNCITAKRFVLIDNKSGLIFIQTCREG